MKRTVRLTLNSRKFGSQTTVEGVHVGDDNSCELIITVTDGNKTLDLLSETTVATMCGTKPDGTVISRRCSIIDNNIVYTLEKQDTAVSGNVLYQVTVVSDDGISQSIIATAKFTVAVMKNIYIPIYRVLESEPSDWSTNYTAYYRLIDNKYVAVSDSSCPAFLKDTFYYLVNPNFNSKDDYGAFQSALARVENLIGRASDILTILDKKINDNEAEHICNKVSAVDFRNLSATDYPNIKALNNYHTNYVEPCYDDINNLEDSKADKSSVDTALSGKLDNAAGSVTTDNIASKAVTSDKIANGAITALKLANNAVSGSNIAQNQISTNHLQNGAVTADKLADKSVAIAKLSDDLLNYIKTSSGTGGGKSAYDIAVNNGFTGTQAEWLESLKGEKGADGKDGISGLDGKDGQNGTDGRGIISTEINANGELVLAYSDGSMANVGAVVGAKGDKGDKGETGATGADGNDYVLTNTDKTEIANIVINEYDSSIMAGTGSLIEIVDSVDEMADTSKKYVLSSTGNIWTFKDTTIIKEITEKIIGTTENPYLDGNRLSSDGSAVTDSAEMVLTPYIDISKYEKYGKIKLKLAGIQYIYQSHTTNVKLALYDDNKNKIICGESCIDGTYGYGGAIGFAIADDNSASVEITIPYTYAGKIVKYMRFNTIGTSAESDITITYKGEVTESQWCDTGVSYGVDNKTKDKISILNNEGADPSSLTLLSQPVLDFYNSDDYPDNDYTITHLSKITYPCRADVPVPYTVKWAHNENAMRTTVAVDTKAIGAINAYTTRTYNATGLDNYPIYNLLPNKTYYYKVTHILSNGNLMEAKSGSFTTSSETIRLLYVDGTQNVRDLGGWTGLNGKKVKYGKLFRGACFSDSSYPGFMLTGKGRLALAELKVQAELNLGATDTETSISSNCAYKKLYYTNYAIAITDSTARANFKILLEWIVSCLDGTLSVSGLETVTRNVYIHCQGGCDRTGTLCFLLLGLLGISESDLAKEYELSSFSDVGFGRLRTTKKAIDVYDYVGMIEALKQYSGTTITEKFVDFATTGCNISMEKINKFRELMLE